MFTFFVLLVAVFALIFWRVSKTVKSDLEGQSPARPPIRRWQKRMAVKPIPDRFVVVDLETTGLDSGRHEIIEIAAIKVERDGENHATFQSLVVPKRRISAKITELTKLDRKTLVRDGRSIEEVLPLFIEFCEGLPMVAFNAKFDRSFIESCCTANGCESPVGEWICALELSRNAWPERQSFKLSSLAADGGLSLDDEHRALGDCRRAMVVYAAAVETIIGPQFNIRKSN